MRISINKIIQSSFLLSLFVIVICSTTTQAAIYRWKDADGSVVFSDKSRGGAERVSLPPLTVIPSLQSAQPRYQAAREARSVNYQVTITSPQAGQTFVKGTEPVSFNAQTDQPLQNGDRLYLYMNGSIIGDGYSSSIDTTNLDRGEYVLSAKVMNSDNQQMSNEAKTSFNIFQRSVLSGKKGR